MRTIIRPAGAAALLLIAAIVSEETTRVDCSLRTAASRS